MKALGAGLQALQAGEIGQGIGLGAGQFFRDHDVLKALAQAQCLQHVLGIGPGGIGHHRHADLLSLGKIQQPPQPGNRRKVH